MINFCLSYDQNLRNVFVYFAENVCTQYYQQESQRGVSSKPMLIDKNQPKGGWFSHALIHNFVCQSEG